MKKALSELGTNFNMRYKHSFWFKLLKLGYIGFWSVVYVLLQILNGIFWLLSTNESPRDDENNFKGMGHQDDRNSDDIWKLSSSNDYYDKEPPDRFS